MNNTSQDRMDELERAWAYLEHASDIHSGRANFFLVAESMLVVALFSISSELPKVDIIQLFICILGIVYTIGWFYVNARLTKRMSTLHRFVMKRDPIYEKYLKSTGGISSNIILSYILPLTMLILWVILIFLV